MNTPSRLLLIISCFCAAIACYALGVPSGGAVFIILGLIFEGLFWMGIFGKKKKSPSTTQK